MPRIPLQTLRFLLVGAAAIIGMLLFVIFPYQQAMRQADEQQRAIELQIEAQRVLHPVFVRYLTRLRQETKGLAAPVEKPLSRGAAGNVYGLFRELAETFALTVKEVVPDPDTMFGGDDRFMVDIAMTGDFDRLQPFLHHIAALPYLDRIDRMQLRAVEAQRELRLRLWLLREVETKTQPIPGAPFPAETGQGSNPS